MTVSAQPVLSPLTGAAIFLVVSIKPGGEEAARDLLPDLAGLQRSAGFRLPEGQLTCVAGISSTAWDRLFGGLRPAGLHPFRELAGPRRCAIATPGDLLFHLRAKHMGLCFELSTLIMDRIVGRVTVEDEVHSFRYYDVRDLLGFVDGTENPPRPAADAAVLVGAEDPQFAGGSYVIVQKYLHDMPAWNALTTEEQERVIGRTKLANVELPDEVKPSNSHVALTTVTGPDGEERKIVRNNMPFGSAGRGEFGTYFIGYAATPDVTEQMLSNMFIGDPPGNYDRILDFSIPVTGGLFFVPPADFLDDPPGPPAAWPAAAVPDTADTAVPGAGPPSGSTAPAAGSLGIGSLKRSVPQ
ncbi:MAG: Dyp-type peroxidase [Actinobacteria bacterium]|nr:Dyp-type peroxidase [Actinomycetota bacterium]